MKTVTTTQKHSQTIRQDLKKRRPIRRRQTHASTSSISAMPETNDQQAYQLIDSYSAFLRDIGPVPISFNQDYRHRPSFAISPIHNVHDGNEPGLSNRHSGFYPVDQHQDFAGENWRKKDVFGWDQWAGNGRIEEADDDAVRYATDGVANQSNNEQEVGSSTAKVNSTSFPSSSVNRWARAEEENVAPSAPLPSSWLRKPSSSRPTLTHPEYRTLKANSPVMARSLKARLSTSVLDNETEVSLIGEILDLLAASQEDVKFMNTFFLAKSHGDELSQQIDLCSRMEESLASLYKAMNLRTQIGAEEWNVRSNAWYQKYSKRLISLRVTLRRLSKMRRLVEMHALRPRHKRSVLTKLEQHEAKLADLASKFTIAFDRLRLRHLHFLLTQSHEEAKRQKEMKRSKLLSRASFERRWKEGKTLRQTLRENYNELRHEFYHNAQRNPRHPCAP